MSSNQVVNIHGKSYLTVAGRVSMAHEANEKTLSITTELVDAENVLFKATVVTPKGTFTGYSAVYSKGMIEKQSPYEVAETSAVGRALGFAGYGAVDSIASADEMVKGGVASSPDSGKPAEEEPLPREGNAEEEQKEKVCQIHGVALKLGISKNKVNKDGTPKKYRFHIDENDNMCFGMKLPA